MQAHDLRREVKKLRDDLDALQDAQQLIEESFGEGLKLFIGETLIDVDEETAQEYQEKLTERKQEELENAKDKLEEIEGEMKNLKSFLYARFGNSINLEEE
jgi:prefoldin subunit 4